MHFTFASAEALSAFSFVLSLSPLSLCLPCPAKLVVVRSGGGRGRLLVLWLLSGFIADLQPKMKSMESNEGNT